MAGDQTGPVRPWHYPLQLFTTLGVVNTFSLLLILIFYQVTYIATIFLKSVWIIFKIPRQWHH